MGKSLIKKKKAINFILDSFAKSFKGKNIFEEQMRYIKPSFIKELAEKFNVSEDKIKELFREGKISIFEDSFLKKVEKLNQ